MPKPKRTWRIPRAMRARTGYFAGLLLIAAGIGLAISLGWGLVTAGAGLIAYFTLLYDVDEPQPYDPDTEGRFR